MPRPRHRRDHDPVPLALDARRVGLQVAERRAEIQRPPPASALAEVIARAAPPAVRAAIPLAPDQADRDHDRVVLVELDGLDDRLLQPQQPRPRTDAYASLAHAADRSFPRFLTVRSRNRRSAAACAPSCPEVGRSRAPTSLPQSAGGRRLSSSAKSPAKPDDASRITPSVRGAA